MRRLIEQITDGDDLSSQQAKAAMRTIMKGEASETEMAAFLIGLKMKGEDDPVGFFYARTVRSDL